MTRKNAIAISLILLVVAATAYWIATHWSYYVRILVGLWPLLVGFLVALATSLEMAWWLRFDPWYYTTGPTSHREQWQTCGSNEQVREAIRPTLDTDKWAGRESVEGFFIRRQSHRRFGSRVYLRLEDTGQGTAVGYEVRPIWTAPLWLIAVAALFFSKFRVFFFVPVISWLVIPTYAYVTAWAVAYYIWLAPREARRLARVKHIRQALAEYRLGVCETCGYDLFGHDEKITCPECGATVEQT